MLPQAHTHRNSVVLLALLFLALDSQVRIATAAAAAAYDAAVLAAAALYAPTADADDAAVPTSV